MKVGFSLSFCVADIMHGVILEDDVQLIVSATNYKSNDDFEDLLKDYRTIYWRTNPDRGEEIARKLHANNKIYQPRVHGLEHPGLSSKWKELHQLSEEECNEYQIPQTVSTGDI